MNFWKGVLIVAALLGAGIAGLAIWSVVDHFEEVRSLSCAEMVPEQHARDVFAAHSDMVRRIGKAGGLSVGVWTDERCKGKAYIQIQYGTVWDRNRIRSLIGRDFFGVPVRMQNV